MFYSLNELTNTSIRIKFNICIKFNNNLELEEVIVFYVKSMYIFRFILMLRFL